MEIAVPAIGGLVAAIGEPVAMKVVTANRGYSEDQYLGRGQNQFKTL